MTKINQDMLKILLIGWVAFFLVGLIANMFLNTKLVILISRSYCPHDQWERLVTNYRQMYQQHQHKSLQIEKVIVFSSFAEQTYTEPPPPEEVYNYQIYGSFDSDRFQKLRDLYPQNKLLSCQ